MLTALVAREQVGRAAALPYLGHAQRPHAHSRRQLPRLVAIAVALPLLGAFIRLGVQLLTYLRLQHLIQDLLKQLRQLVIPGKQSLQCLTLKRNLVLGPLVLSG